MYLMGMMMASLGDPNQTTKLKHRKRRRNKYMYQVTMREGRLLLLTDGLLSFFFTVKVNYLTFKRLHKDLRCIKYFKILCSVSLLILHYPKRVLRPEISNILVKSFYKNVLKIAKE